VEFDGARAAPRVGPLPLRIGMYRDGHDKSESLAGDSAALIRLLESARTFTARPNFAVAGWPFFATLPDARSEKRT
jgi:hypothetical protein